jgi:LEA14-like dessication related protein
MSRSPLSVLWVLSVLFVLSACSAIENVVRQPDVSLTDVRLLSASLAGADLLFKFRVDNPNSRGMVLDGVGYKLRLNGEPMLEGRRDERIEIAAGESTVELPMTVGYQDLYRVIRSLTSTAKPTYNLDAEFRFSVPILGSITVPVSRRGEIPLDKVHFGLGG